MYLIKSIQIIIKETQFFLYQSIKTIVVILACYQVVPNLVTLFRVSRSTVLRDGLSFPSGCGLDCAANPRLHRLDFLSSEVNLEPVKTGKQSHFKCYSAKTLRLDMI